MRRKEPRKTPHGPIAVRAAPLRASPYRILLAAVCLDIRTARFDGTVAHTIVLLPTMLIIGYM